MTNYYDKEGTAITLFHWQRLMEDQSYRRIAYTSLPNGIDVSTVWVGLACDYGSNGPQIFETMVRDENGWGEQYRYATKEEALKGHKARVYTHSDGDSPSGEESRWSQIINEEDE